MKLFLWLLKYPKTVLSLYLLLGIFCAWYIAGIPVESSIEKMFVQHDPVLKTYNKLKDLFGGEFFFVIAIKEENLFTIDNLKTIEHLTEAFKDIDNVTRVISLSNMPLIFADEDTIEIKPFFQQIPENRDELLAFKDKVMDTPLARDMLISDDAKTTAITVFVKNDCRADKPREKVINDLKATFLQYAKPEWPFHLGGDLVLTQKIANSIRGNLITFSPLTLGVLAIILTFLFRKWYGVVLPAFCFFITLTAIISVIRISGRPLNILTTLLPPLILVIGTSIVIHIINHYYEELAQGLSQQQALEATIRHIGPPCFLNAITTAMGFASLMTSDIVPIREFGLYTSIALLFAFVFSLSIVPTALSLLKPPQVTRKKRSNRLTLRTLNRLSSFNQRYQRSILVIMVLVIVVAGYGTSLIKAETHFVSYFFESDPFRQTLQFIEDNLAGTSNMDIMIDTGKPDGIKQPENLRFMKELHQYIGENYPEVDKVTSVVNLLMEMNKALNEGRPEYHKLPETYELAGQYFLLYSMSDDAEALERIVNYDYSLARIQIRMQMCSSVRIEKIVKDLRAYLNRSLPVGVEAKITGVSALYANMANTLVRGQVKSFGLAIAVITIMMAIMFRSIRLGLFSMVPNVLPIMFTFGVMGYVGIRLNTATAMSASVAIGIAVDDTIHFLSRYLKEFAKDHHYVKTMERSMKTIGVSIIFTSIVITLGFLVILNSDYKPFIYFGLLTALTMVTALLGDLILLPVTLIFFKPKLNAKNKNKSEKRF